MTTGLRASVLACATRDLGPPTWLMTGLKAHGTALARSELLRVPREPRPEPGHRSGRCRVRARQRHVEVDGLVAVGRARPRERRCRRRHERAVGRLPDLQLVPLRAGAPPSHGLQAGGPVGVRAGHEDARIPRVRDRPGRHVRPARRHGPPGGQAIDGTNAEFAATAGASGPEAADHHPPLRGGLPVRPIRVGRRPAVRRRRRSSRCGSAPGSGCTATWTASRSPCPLGDVACSSIRASTRTRRARGRLLRVPRGSQRRRRRRPHVRPRRRPRSGPWRRPTPSTPR